ncbi:MAG: penicillin acylase family protein, partial [Acetobacteraceae bacterium]|nr:penicillin acylase family protein [Acetobacteraceae bacterium]
AAATPDLFFGLGVAMAQDRLWQMDRLRRRALGQQAEILGSAYLPSDIAHRTVGIPAIAAREAEAMDAQTRATVEALVRGINRQIEAFGTALPIEFLILEDRPRPFTVADIVAIGRGIWWSLNGRIDRIMAAEAAHMIEDEALRLLYLTPEGSEHLVLPSTTVSGDPLAARVAAGTDDATGSNNWAISGSRTATGKPILAGDPHQPFWVPSSWYEYGLHGPEDDVAGAGHPGFPGLWWASTGKTAWAITNNAASTRDLYRETVDPQDPSRYREGDGFLPFAERSETIQIRGEPAHQLTVRETVRGPVINALVPSMAAEGDPPTSLRWVGMEHIDDIRAGLALSRAKNWDGFRAALRDWSIAVFNFVYADAAGNIGYQMAGRIPIRGRITYGVRDAANPDDSWRGYIPFEDLPHVLNPNTGTVASANQRIVPGDYKQPIYGAYSQGHRGLRLHEAFQELQRADVPASVALQNDIKNCRAARLAPHIVSLLRDATGPAATVRDLLAGWDGTYTLESAAPTVFEAFMAEWQEAVLGEVLPARLIPTCMQQTGVATTLLEEPGRRFFSEGIPARAVSTAAKVVEALQRRLGEGAAAWAWGRVHLAHWKHPLSGAGLGAAADIGPAPVTGGSHTIRNTGGELPPHNAGSGAEYRIIVDFSAPDTFRAVQNIGNSGIPGSPHYRDQFEPWLRGEYHTVALRRSGVEADRAVTTTITPA